MNRIFPAGKRRKIKREQGQNKIIIKEDIIMGKQLYKSATNRKICGVCGGIGEYFNIDPTLVRVAWAILACTGTGIIAYLACAIIIPD